MARTAADVLADRLIDWGVSVIFGLPGDGINGIMEALRVRQDKVSFVQVRHEESAAFMACGYAKYTGRIGVCLATSGPGAIHLLNGLYDAKLDHAPVLAITGQTYHDLIGTQYPVVDPFEPPMPARVKPKQALRMAESLARGELNRGRIALTLFRDKISDLKGH